MDLFLCCLIASYIKYSNKEFMNTVLQSTSVQTYTMALMQKKVENKDSKKKVMIMVEVKKEIIEKYEQGI